MRALVTGASGRVGALVAHELESRNWNLRLLQRGESAPPPADADGVEVLIGSVQDRDLLCDAVQGVDVVCHLAALMPPHDNDSLFECNVRGTSNLLEAIRTAARPPRLVFASSDATYGTGLSRRTYPTPIGEELTPSPTNFYGLTKVVGEQMIRGYVDLYGLTAVILRFCWVFGPGEVLDLFKLETWNEFMTPEQHADLAGSTDVPVLFADDGEPFCDHVIDARDAAHATMLAIDATVDDNPTLNICGPNSFRYVDVAPRVAKAQGRQTVDLILSGFHPYTIDTTRAERTLDFRAEYDIDAMLDEALREQDEANG